MWILEDVGMGKWIGCALAFAFLCGCAGGGDVDGNRSRGVLTPPTTSSPIPAGSSAGPWNVGASGAGTGPGIPTMVPRSTGTAVAGTVGLPMAGSVGLPMTGGVATPMTAGGAPLPPPRAGTGAPPPPPPPPPIGGMAAPPPMGSKTAVIPKVAGDCPTFSPGSMTFMGPPGILVDSGPKPAGPTAPMVFYWHGTLLSASAYALDLGPILSGVKSEGGVVVAFEGSTGGDLLSGTFIFGESDFKLTDQLVACAVEKRNVDPKRIYATGCSAGGLFSAAMAAERSSYMAAAATNSGGWTIPLPFDSMNTPALMTVHGAPGVDVVAIDFSDSSKTADMGFKQRGGFVINCNTGGGHCGGAYLAGGMWDFFKAHPYGVDPKPWTSLPAGFPRECKIF